MGLKLRGRHYGQ
uniref:Uncharacterized protein n=1 Tax=Arundo donax TaxID=35708 RepID=A0A0A9EUU0_ARUDO